MRPIEFRAWLKMYNVMVRVEWIQLSPTDSTYKIAFSGRVDRVLKKEVSDYAKLDELELMQFTGLLDKNRKKIFEGDIVRWADGHIDKVEWFYGAWRISCKPIQEGEWSLLFPHTQQLEVIGNIYENSSLLKE